MNTLHFDGKLIAKKKKNENIFQTFDGHTTDALLILRDYMIKNKNVLEEFSKNFNIDFNTLCNLLFLSVYLHDIGKLTDAFQKRIVNGQSCGSVSHAFFGLPFVNSNLPEHFDTILKLVVLSHHSQLYNSIFDPENAKLENKGKNIGYNTAYIKKHIEGADDTYRKYFSDSFTLKYFSKDERVDYLGSLELNNEIHKKIHYILKRNINNKHKDVKTKAIYCLVLSVLKHCDQKASKNFEDNLDLKEGTTHESIIEDDLKGINYSLDLFNISDTELLDNNNPYLYQDDIQENNVKGIDYYGIISAPCGRGKTESSLISAINILKKYNKNKIIFALPTQITSNAMFKRFEKVFGKDNIGIYHGMSRFLRYGDNEVKDEDVRELVYDEKVFAKPITITTIDHLIYTLVHGYKQADYALGNILNSVVIFDEIHYYETHTLRHIIDATKILKEFKIPHIAMSGTLPAFIINELGEDYKLIEDKEGFDFKPFSIKQQKHSIFDVDTIKKIKDIYSEKKKQIIIVNTVDRAQSMYKKLKDELKNDIDEEHLILYNSRFTHYDRAYSEESKEKKIFRLKNKEITGNWIIISTQAIEISVDISCDIMHTEYAPIDAIGQRGGRLNRGAKKSEGCVMYLYEPENHTPYCIRKDDIDFVEKSKKAICDGEVTYRLIKEWCDKVYDDIKLTETNLHNVFECCILFGKSAREVRGINEEEGGNLIEIRKSDYATIDVIPEKYWNEHKEDLRKIEMFKVKIPYWGWYSKYNDKFYPSDKNKRNIICTIPYSKEYGFDLKKIEDCEEHTIIC